MTGGKITQQQPLTDSETTPITHSFKNMLLFKEDSVGLCGFFYGNNLMGIREDVASAVHPSHETTHSS